MVDQIAAALRQAADAAGVNTADLAGVGVGSPGAVDAEMGVVSEARNLPDWEEAFPLALALSERVGCPVSLGNDVQVAVDGEFALGAGRRSSSLLGVWWGTGVGGGIVLDGKPWVGRGAAAEIGHVVVKMDGALCTCGRRGCMEAYAGRARWRSRPAVAREGQGRRTCSRSWRSAAGPGCRAGSGSARWIARTRSP